jgi:hypothetical protein
MWGSWIQMLLQPYFEKSVSMRLTLPKWELGSPSGLSKLQSSITRVKTPRIGAFFTSLKSYQNAYVKNGLAWAIWTFAAHKLWQKERSGIKLAIWFPTTKSWESAQPRCVQVEWNTLLENSRREIQVCFRPHPNRRSEQRIMTLQSGGSLNRDNFETPLWESRDKKPFECRCCGEAQIILYGGRWWLPPSPGHGESCESKVARGLS